MNDIVSFKNEYDRMVADVLDFVSKNKNVFGKVDATDILVQLDSCRARHQVLHDIAVFMDKQQRKLSSEITNLERKLKRDEGLVITNEELSLERQSSTLWELNTKLNHKVEWKQIYFLLKGEEKSLLEQLVGIQTKLAEMMEAKAGA